MGELENTLGWGGLKKQQKLLYLQFCVILFYFFPQIVAISFNIM